MSCKPESVSGLIQAAMANYHQLGTYCFSHAGGWKSKIRLQAGSVLGGAHFQVRSRCLLPVSSYGVGANELPWSSLKRMWIPVVRALPQHLITSPYPHLLMSPFWQLGFQHMNCEVT